MTTFDPDAPSTAEPRHILVVDDDELLREVAKAALELVGGWRVSTADCGSQVRELAAVGRPDAILLDVMMPGLDGPSTVVGLHDDPATRDIPIIFLTAKMQADGLASWRSLGLAGVIQKPFDPMTLAASMSSLLGWQE